MASRHYSRSVRLPGKKRPEARDAAFCPAGIKDLCRTVVLHVIEQPKFRDCIDLMFKHADWYKGHEPPFKPARETYTCDADDDPMQQVSWQIEKSQHVHGGVHVNGEIQATGGPKVVELYVSMNAGRLGSTSESIEVRFTPRYLGKDLSYVTLAVDNMIREMYEEVQESIKEMQEDTA